MGKQKQKNEADTEEIERYRRIAKEGHHTLPYKEFLRAKELGIELPEADPVYEIGSERKCPLPIRMPKDFPLESCYRVPRSLEVETLYARDNTHLLAALGDLPMRFVPVWIEEEYDGYRWAKLPTVEDVRVTEGKKLYRASVRGHIYLECVDSLVIAVQTSDGRKLSGNVCLAAGVPTIWCPGSGTQTIYVTPEAHTRLLPANVMSYLAVSSDDPLVTRYLTMLSDLWLLYNSHEEAIRQTIVDHLERFSCEWQTIARDDDGGIEVEMGLDKWIHLHPDLKKRKRAVG